MDHENDFKIRPISNKKLKNLPFYQMQKDIRWPMIGSHFDSHDTNIPDIIYSVGQAKMRLQEQGLLKGDFRTDGGVAQFFNGTADTYQRQPLSDKQADAVMTFMNNVVVRSFAHCPFCINLSKDPLEDSKSLAALHADIKAMGKAGITSVCHIGHHLNKYSISSVCRTLSCLDFWGPNNSYPLLLENAAGDGTELGVSWEELHFLAQNTDPHVGFCIDTQHSFAGLKPDLTSPDGVNEFLKQIDRSVGLNRVKLFHLNDSLWNPDRPKGKKDAHANIGFGQIWGKDVKALAGLKHLLLRGAELDIPFVTETEHRPGIPDDPTIIYALLRNPSI